METHAFGFRLPANAPDGQKRFPIRRSDTFRSCWQSRTAQDLYRALRFLTRDAIYRFVGIVNADKLESLLVAAGDAYDAAIQSSLSPIHEYEP